MTSNIIDTMSTVVTESTIKNVLDFDPEKWVIDNGALNGLTHIYRKFAEAKATIIVLQQRIDELTPADPIDQEVKNRVLSQIESILSEESTILSIRATVEKHIEDHIFNIDYGDMVDDAIKDAMDGVDIGDMVNDAIENEDIDAVVREKVRDALGDVSVELRLA
jgi:hypothetical protein